MEWMLLYQGTIVEMCCCPALWLSKSGANVLKSIALHTYEKSHWICIDLCIFRLVIDCKVNQSLNWIHHFQFHLIRCRHWECQSIYNVWIWNGKLQCTRFWSSFFSFSLSFLSEWIKVKMHNLCILENEYWQGITVFKSIKRTKLYAMCMFQFHRTHLYVELMTLAWHR